MAWRCSGVVAAVIVSEKVRRFTSGCVSPVGVVYSTAKPASDALSEGSMSKARRAERSPAYALKARPSFAVCFSIRGMGAERPPKLPREAQLRHFANAPLTNAALAG